MEEDAVSKRARQGGRLECWMVDPEPAACRGDDPERGESLQATTSPQAPGPAPGSVGPDAAGPITGA